MAVTPVNLCPDLQAWHLAGLASVMFEQDSTLDRLVGESWPELSSAFGQAEKDNARPTAKNSPSGLPGHPGYRRIPATGWPEPWQKAFAKSRPAPIVWTYAELGEDLLLMGSPMRSQILRTIISTLDLKKGRSAFWPITVPSLTGKTAPANMDIFHSGLDELGARLLICFGKKALSKTAYFTETQREFQEIVAAGRLILLLPDINTLFGNLALLESIAIFLRTAIAKLNLN